MEWTAEPHTASTTTRRTETKAETETKIKRPGQEIAVIRIFKVYYPARILVLLGGEALIVWTSFLLATLLQHPNDSYVLLNYEGGYYKILGITTLVLIISHWFDLYDPSHFDVKGELYFRLLLVPGLLSFRIGRTGIRVPASHARQVIVLSGIDFPDYRAVGLAHDLYLVIPKTLSAGAGLCIGRRRTGATPGARFANAQRTQRRRSWVERECARRGQSRELWQRT